MSRSKVSMSDITRSENYSVTLTFDELFAEVPVGTTVLDHWAGQDLSVLDSAAAVIASHGAEPWVFCADARHFWQFAGKKDVAAVMAMSKEEVAAVLGWESFEDEDDFDPASFGYTLPD